MFREGTMKPPHSGLRRDFRSISGKIVILSIGTPYVPTVLPTVWPMDHLLPGYSINPVEVSFVVCFAEIWSGLESR